MNIYQNNSNQKNIIELLKEKLTEWGASLSGFAYIKDALPVDLRPLPYSITIGIRLSDFIINQIKTTPTYSYFHHYRTVNSLIDNITLRTMLYLQESGFNAFSIAASQSVNNDKIDYAGIIPHKTGAVLSGLGWIGKSGLFISEKHGPRVRLGTILTDMELPVSDYDIKSKCGDCRICVDNCPANAIKGNNWIKGDPRKNLVDPDICSKHMTKYFSGIGRGSVCGICVKVCPYGVPN